MLLFDCRFNIVHCFSYGFHLQSKLDVLFSENHYFQNFMGEPRNRGNTLNIVAEPGSTSVFKLALHRKPILNSFQMSKFSTMWQDIFAGTNSIVFVQSRS